MVLLKLLNYILSYGSYSLEVKVLLVGLQACWLRASRGWLLISFAVCRQFGSHFRNCYAKQKNERNSNNLFTVFFLSRHENITGMLSQIVKSTAGKG